MLNKIGRLDADDKKELYLMIQDIFSLIDNEDEEKVKKELKRIGMTQNYFIREYIGQELGKLDTEKKLYDIFIEFLNHKFYGSRAIAIFYLSTMHANDVEKIFSILEQTFETTHWEVEAIIADLWKADPDFMKTNMLEWIQSDNPLRRALSFHGMEHISNTDPTYVMDFIEKAIDDNTIEVQKKITHVLTQIARDNPIIVYPYVRKWLLDASDKRIKTIWISMKKLANIVNQRARRDFNDKFVMLTEQTIDDWTHDNNQKVVTMGNNLQYIISRRYAKGKSNDKPQNSSYDSNRHNNNKHSNHSSHSSRNNRSRKRY